MKPWSEFWARQTGRQDGPRMEWDSPLELDDLFIEDRQVVFDSKDQVDCITFKVWLKDDDGVSRPYWKAVKLGRIVRVPVWLRQDIKLMQLQDDIIAGAWESGLNYITLLANIIKPKPFGLLQCYGVQVLGDSAEEARYYANQDYHALTAMLTGSFRGIEYRPLREGEAEWLRDKMASMKRLIMLRGIPSPRNTAALNNMSSVMGGEMDSQSEEQMEQFVRGMSTREFVFLLLATPLDTQALSNWLATVSQEMTNWKSQMQGSRVISAGLSMPMAFSANMGSAAASSHGVATGENYGQTVGHSESVGLAHSLTLSNQVSHGQSVGVTQGLSMTNNATHSVGQGASVGHSVGVSEQASVGQNWSHGVNESQSLSVGQSHTQSVGSSFGESLQQGQTHGVSTQSSLTQSHSVGTTLSDSHGLTVGQSQQVSVSHSHGVGSNQSNSSSQTLSHGLTDTISRQLSSSQGIGNSQSLSHGRTTGASEGASVTHNVGDGSTVNSSVNNSVNGGAGGGVPGVFNVKGGFTHGGGTGASNQLSQSVGGTNNVGLNNSDSTSYSGGVNHSSSVSQGAGSSVGQSTTDSTGLSHSAGSSQNWTSGVSQSAGHSQSSSFTSSQSESASNSTGASYGVGQNWGQSTGEGVTAQQTTSTSNGTTVGMSQSQGQSWSAGGSQSLSHGVSQQDSATNQISQTNGQGLSLGSTKGMSDTSSVSTSQGVSQGTTASQTQGASTGQSWGQTQSQSMANQVSDSLGSGANLAVGPFFSLSKSFQWEDIGVANLVAIMQHQRERLLQSLQGQGAMYSDVYILVEDADAQSAATAVAKTAFYGDVFPTPLEVMVLSDEEQAHQAYHAQAFSSCNAREPNPNLLDTFRYSTVLLAREMAAYSHPLRVELGGASTVTENIPVLRVNPERHGEVYHGVQVSGERWDPELGYKTPFEWRIGRDELMHTNISGRSRSGKTVGATRFIAETYQNMTFGTDETGTERRMSAIILDWKQDWRILKRFVPPESFRFMSLSDPNLNPIRFNLLAVPNGVYPQRWADTVIELFCLSFSLGGRAKSILWQHIQELYTKHDVYDNPENSLRATMYELYQSVANKQKSFTETEKGKTARVGNDTKDAYQRVLDRLVYFSDRLLRDLYCDTSADAIGITDIVSAKNTVTVLEGAGLDAEMKQFVIGTLAAGVYQYTTHNGKYDPGLLLVFEEAHQVLKGSGSDAGGGDNGSVLNMGETIYEQMWNEAAGWNLFLVSISQMPSRLPPSVISNSGLVYSYALDDTKDREVIMKKIARDPRYDHREIERFFPRMPIGWCIAKSSRIQDYKDADPSIVATDPLIAEPVTNEELRREQAQTPV